MVPRRTCESRRRQVCFLLLTVLAGDRIAAVSLTPSMPRLVATWMVFSRVLASADRDEHQSGYGDNLETAKMHTKHVAHASHERLSVEDQSSGVCGMLVDDSEDIDKSFLQHVTGTTSCKCRKEFGVGADGQLKKYRVKCYHNKLFVQDTFFTLPLKCAAMHFTGLPSRATCALDESSYYWNTACRFIHAFVGAMGSIAGTWFKVLDVMATGSAAKLALEIAEKGVEIVEGLGYASLLTGMLATTVNLFRTLSWMFCGGPQCVGIFSMVKFFFGVFGAALFFFPPLAAIIMATLGLVGAPILVGITALLLSTWVRHVGKFACGSPATGSSLKVSMSNRVEILGAAALLEELRASNKRSFELQLLDSTTVEKVTNHLSGKPGIVDDHVNRVVQIQQQEDHGEALNLLNLGTNITQLDNLEGQVDDLLENGRQKIEESLKKPACDECNTKGSLMSAVTSAAVQKLDVEATRIGDEKALADVKNLKDMNQQFS